MTKVLDVSGNKYGLLKVISRNGKTKDGKATWNCVCDCGNKTVVESYKLRSGNNTSCGCKKKQGLHTTHGLSKKKNRLYNIWLGMKQRCYYVNATSYKNYGGRGIAVCDRWRYSFENFYNDMVNSYFAHLAVWGKENTTLDRKDNNGNYELSNCRWATRSEQYQNSRSAIKA